MHREVVWIYDLPRPVNTLTTESAKILRRELGERFLVCVLEFAAVLDHMPILFLGQIQGVLRSGFYQFISLKMKQVENCVPDFPRLPRRHPGLWPWPLHHYLQNQISGRFGSCSIVVSQFHYKRDRSLLAPCFVRRENCHGLIKCRIGLVWGVLSAIHLAWSSLNTSSCWTLARFCTETVVYFACCRGFLRAKPMLEVQNIFEFMKLLCLLFHGNNPVGKRAKK